MSATESDVLEARIARIEASLHQIEQRLATIEAGEGQVFQPVPLEEPPSPMFDFALIGQSVLIVGGAYLLRALTEVGLLPQLAGVALGFIYALAWIVLADRAAQPLYRAGTGALIAGALILEAAARFHVLAPEIGALLVTVTALALLVIAGRRESNAIALVATAMATLTLTGLAIGTAGVLPCAIAAAVIGVVARRRSAILIIVSDFFALVLIGMALLQQTPRLSAEVVLVAFAIAWMVWPGPIQTTVALFIGIGGASLLALDALALAILWSVIAVVTARFARQYQPALWMIAATVAAFVANALPVVGVLALVALVLLPAEALYPRLVLLMIVTLAALAGVNSLLPATDAGMLAMQRSIVLALTAVLLSFLGRARPEAAIAARIVLAFAALKFLFEDFRFGRATTIAVALVAYGTALLIISRKGESMKRILALTVLLAFPLFTFADDAAALYKSKCAMCHGATGTGDTPMGKKLTIKPLGSADVQKNTDDKLAQIIAKGSGKMPAFAGKLTNDQIKQLVAVVRSFAKK